MKQAQFETGNSVLQGRIDGFIERKLAEHPDLRRSVTTIVRDLEADQDAARSARADTRSQMDAFGAAKVHRFRGLQFAA